MKSRHLARRRGLALASAATLVVAVTATATMPTTAAPSPQPAAVPALPGGEVERIGGVDRYETAALIAQEYPEGVDTVFVATGELFPDALSARSSTASVSAGTEGQAFPDVDASGLPAPVLLTEKNELPQFTIDALESLQPTQIIIVGGERAVSAEVETNLKDYGEVERLAGDDRYGTSAEVAAQFPTGLPVVFVATGENFPDALTGGAVAGRSGAPILLTDGEALSDPTAEALADLEPQSVVVFGGPRAVSDTVLDSITAIVPDTTRVFGEDRYGTASVIASIYEKDLETVYLATGLDYPDALTGSALAGFEGVPVLLSKPTEVPEFTLEGLDYLSAQGITLLGGPRALSDDIARTLEPALAAWIDSAHLQLLSFNDYHGHIEDEDATLSEEQDPEQNIVGGAEYLSTTLDALRSFSLPDQTLTVTAGDLIGGSPFLSGIFHDEPSVESLNLMGLDISSVGNHEFDEGTEELLRMQDGGCHPEDDCYFPDDPYAGADFQWLSANVVDKETGETLLPATSTRTVAGVPVGFIGMTLEATPTLVSPGGVDTVRFLDEVETANAQAAELQSGGVESIVVLLHEGGFVDGFYNGCEGISGAIVDIAERLDPAIDMVVTGHTHEPYVCSIDDPAGDPRLVTSANQYGRVVTDTDLVLSRSTGDVLREESSAVNELVLQDAADPALTALIAKWKEKSDELAAEVVGTVLEDITGDASGNRGIETPLADLVADSILFGTDGADEGGAQVSFMNVGGVRASLLFDQITNGEQPGEVTYAEAFAVMPFGNILVSIDMTGQDIKDVLEQQYDPTRSRQYLALGVSEGFSYTWDDTQPQGSKVSGMTLDGMALDLGATYRVSTLNFLQEGGDKFTAFTRGTNLLGGPEDLANFVDYLQANPGLTPPEDRVNGL